MKVTATKCVNGKRHKWKDIRIFCSSGSTNYTSWCKRCGCMTDFYKNEKMKKRERCYENNGLGKNVFYVDIPEHLKE